MAKSLTIRQLQWQRLKIQKLRYEPWCGRECIIIHYPVCALGYFGNTNNRIEDNQWEIDALSITKGYCFWTIALVRRVFFLSLKIMNYYCNTFYDAVESVFTQSKYEIDILLYCTRFDNDTVQNKNQNDQQFNRFVYDNLWKLQFPIDNNRKFGGKIQHKNVWYMGIYLVKNYLHVIFSESVESHWTQFYL